MSVTVQVTTAHIKAGRPGRCRECPVALAVADAICGAALVSACPAWITMFLQDEEDGREVRVSTPRHVAAFIRAFDARRYVAPFDFTFPAL